MPAPPRPGPGADPEPTDFERRLARLRPSVVALDRDRMLYEAGRAAALAEAGGRALPAIAAGLAVVAVALGSLLARERAGRRGPEVAIAASGREAPPIAPVLAPPARPIEPDSYLALRRQVLAGGLEPSPAKALDLVPTGPDDPPAPLRVRSRVVDL